MEANYLTILKTSQYFKKFSCYMCYIYMCCSVTQSYPTLCDPIDCSTPGLPVPHQHPKFAQVHVHCIGSAIQPSHPLTPSSPCALNLSQHQGLFQGVGYLHQAPKYWSFSFSILVILEVLQHIHMYTILIYE